MAPRQDAPPASQTLSRGIRLLEELADARAPLTIDDRVDAYEREARAWYERYRRPFWVAETSNLGLAVDDGPVWLDRLTGAIERMRADGLPVHGICWYSRGDQYDWHTMLVHPVLEVTEVGLFDVDRRPRPVAAAYAALAARWSA